MDGIIYKAIDLRKKYLLECVPLYDIKRNILAQIVKACFENDGIIPHLLVLEKIKGISHITFLEECLKILIIDLNLDIADWAFHVQDCNLMLNVTIK